MYFELERGDLRTPVTIVNKYLHNQPSKLQELIIHWC